MIVSIHQPNYWPWLGLLDKISKSDIYVVLDHVPANKETNQYRNIFCCDGKAKYLTLPVNYKMGKAINELIFKNDNWQNDHINKLYNYYRNAPYFNEIMPAVKRLYETSSGQYAVDFIIKTMMFSFDILDINTKVVRSSSLNPKGAKAALVLDICRSVCASIYLSGRGGLNYMDDDDIQRFSGYGIELKWQEFEHPVYTQKKDNGFIPGLACLDLFFWQGKDKSRRFLRGTRGRELG